MTAEIDMLVQRLDERLVFAQAQRVTDIHSHEKLHKAMAANLLERFEAQRNAVAERYESQMVHLQERFESQKLSVAEALTAQQHQTAAAFAAAEKAVDSALAASEKHKDERFAAIWTEFHEHLVAVREENALAFASSEKAIAKAEAAMERRLDGMNEFRAQLRDQAQTFMHRDESIQRHDATGLKIDAVEQRLGERIDAAKGDSNKSSDGLDEKIATLDRTMTQKITDLSSRIDKRDGELAGRAVNTNNLRATIGTYAAIITVIMTIVVLVANHKFGA